MPASVRPAGAVTRGYDLPWIFVLPALALYGALILVPAAASSWYAFTDWDGLSRSASWVGLTNFRDLLEDDQARSAFTNTLKLTFVVVIVQNAIGLLLALGLHRAVRTRNFLRTLFFAPVALSPLVVAYIWQFMYSSHGAVDRVLETVGLGSAVRPWLGDPDVALYAIALTIVWQYTGYSMVIFLAGLERIPEDVYDATAIDGANAWQRFRDIVFPLLAPALTINIVIASIMGLKQFDQVFAMTQGGPGYATETVTTDLYKQAFVYGDYAYGTALALGLDRARARIRAPADRRVAPPGGMTACASTASARSCANSA